MGYAENGLQYGATMATPQFLNIDSPTTYPLDAIVPSGSDTSDNVSVQTLDAFGRGLASYVWNDWMFENACWVNDSLEQVEGVSFEPGQGLWITASSSEQSIQSFGQVGSADVTVRLRYGATATGNPFPLPIDLDSIIAEGADTSDNVSVQTLDAFGRGLASYVWNDWMFGDACWVDDSLEQVSDVSYPAGQGLWVTGSSDAQYIRFTAPNL